MAASLGGRLGVSVRVPLFGILLGPSWGPPGPSWAPLGPSWGPLGQSWVASRGPPGKPHGGLLGSFRGFLGCLGAILGVLGPSWTVLGASWGPL
eukprot:6575575-Pyramimonas_sp.AAC.1